MALAVVGRHGLEFQPHPEVTGSGSWRRVGIRVWKLVFGVGGLAAVSASFAIAIGALYAAGRGSSLSSGSALVPRLAVATAIGLLLTAVHNAARRKRSADYSLMRAQTLLCLAGALTMMLIDNSVARAFAIAGAASIVRFRTPVDDPTDAMVLFLAMVLGMASGIGAFGVAAAGVGGVCVLLALFSAAAPEPRRRMVTIELVARGREFPALHVRRILARHSASADPCEWSQDTNTRVKYRACIGEAVPLDVLGAELMDDGNAGLESVAWEIRKA